MRIAGAAGLVFASAAWAFAAPDGDAPQVELPLGNYVRPGRPLDVRVIGGADRVRAAGTPWALPQGERGDEFILQTTSATVGVLTLEIERGGRVDRVSPTVETLAAEADVVGTIGDAMPPRGARAVRLPATRLPTVREAWLLLDSVTGGSVPGLRGTDGLSAAGRGLREPLLLPPGPLPFLVAAEAAARGPGLPGDVAAALEVLALTEIVLVGLLALRRDPPWRRTAWIAAPAVVAFAFISTGDRLPGALRADAMALSSERTGVLVLVRVEARRGGRASFDLPAGAGSAAVLRYAPDDDTVTSVSAGRRVELELPAGQSRVFAYAFESGAATDREADVSAPPSLANWLAGSGLRPDLRGSYGFAADLVPRGTGTRVVAGFAATASAVPPTK